MKIALFPSAFHPSLGGVEELSRQLAHALVRRGHSVKVLTNRWPRDLPAHEQFEGLELHRLAFRSPAASMKARLSFAASKGSIIKNAAQLCRDCDVVHVQCVAANAFYALEAAKANQLPVVVTSQGERTMDATRVYERSVFLNTTLKRALNEAAQISACSRDTLRDLEVWSKTEFGSRGHVVYNGIKLSDFEGAKPFQNPKSYVFALGRMVPQKGFDVLIEAWKTANLEGWELLIAGDGPEKANLSSQIENAKLPSVRLVGRANRAEVAAYFAGCEFFVLPSRHEPQGIVNLEAMASGKPVLATAVGGVPEIVDEASGLLVPGDNAPALAAGLKTLAADFSQRSQMGKAAKTHARNFDWDAIAAQYESLYRAAMNK